MNQLIPTQIVDRNGKVTTVHKKEDLSSDSINRVSSPEFTPSGASEQNRKSIMNAYDSLLSDGVIDSIVATNLKSGGHATADDVRGYARLSVDYMAWNYFDKLDDSKREKAIKGELSILLTDTFC